jgi:hypothetical protein
MVPLIVTALLGREPSGGQPQLASCAGAERYQFTTFRKTVKTSTFIDIYRHSGPKLSIPGLSAVDEM